MVPFLGFPAPFSTLRVPKNHFALLEAVRILCAVVLRRFMKRIAKLLHSRSRCQSKHRLVWEGRENKTAFQCRAQYCEKVLTRPDLKRREGSREFGDEGGVRVS